MHIYNIQTQIGTLNLAIKQSKVDLYLLREAKKYFDPRLVFQFYHGVKNSFIYFVCQNSNLKSKKMCQKKNYRRLRALRVSTLYLFFKKLKHHAKYDKI